MGSEPDAAPFMGEGRISDGSGRVGVRGLAGVGSDYAVFRGEGYRSRNAQRTSLKGSSTRPITRANNRNTKPVKRNNMKAISRKSAAAVNILRSLYAR